MSTSQKYDLLIVGGTVIDGTRRPRFDADVGVKDGRIVAVGDLSGHDADLVLPAHGKIVAPGFIDSHTHDDQAVLTQPDMPFKVSQGVATVVTGNCGISLAPLRADAALPSPLNLLEADGGERFPTFRAYVDALRARPAAVNVVPMVGHTTLRVMAMQDLDRAATEPEVRAMRALLQEALDAGAVGMSTGTYYPPAAAATTQEVVEVSRPLAAKQALYVTHMRNEADRCMESLEETFSIGREVDTPVLVSHHKLMREANFGKSVQTLQRIEQAMRCQCVSLDCYPYTASSTMLHLDEERLQGKVVIASSGAFPGMQGRDLQDIADEWGVSRVEASRRLQPASAIYYSMDEQDVQRILAFEPTMIGSDGIPSGDRPHPRLWGTFPRVLGRYSRDIGLFPLETAVWKMTGLTAGVFGLEGRGVIAEGHHADITIFDAETVHDTADYDNPMRPARGIEAVVVNGAVAYRDGEHLHTRSGAVLGRMPGRAQG
ncbi:N-acyl-D-amino-acid deacylase [Bordetella ansorpii]|uniref:N-acyl-D-amino-acid deacylase n=1 Tax=Bordetella ansorpii TaxID=288768 RepID=A0A157SRY8_9BORD|nr:D-aminoacylase [Bordetella ansorpii]SAI73197.1 N-acyl-D-amino-acid deacylase [Bordetella ansorpii]